MPNKMPYIQWFPADWIAATTMLSPATRGIWFDILNVMWQLDRAEKITGTVAELARAGRCDAVQMQTAIDELTAFHVADVTERDGIVTVVCRRFKKANAERVRAANGMRVTRKLRKSDGNVTEMLHPNITEIKNQKSEKDTTAPMPLTSVPDEVRATDAGDEKKQKPEKIFFDYEGDCRIHGITPEQIARWREQFPALDIEAELKAASAWLDGNRKNRKTDIRRFLTNWLIRHQDKAPTVGATPRYGRQPIDYAKVKAEAEKLGDMWEDGK